MQNTNLFLYTSENDWIHSCYIIMHSLPVRREATLIPRAFSFTKKFKIPFLYYSVRPNSYLYRYYYNIIVRCDLPAKGVSGLAPSVTMTRTTSLRPPATSLWLFANRWRTTIFDRSVSTRILKSINYDNVFITIFTRRSLATQPREHSRVNVRRRRLYTLWKILFSYYIGRHARDRHNPHKSENWFVLWLIWFVCKYRCFFLYGVRPRQFKRDNNI